MDNNEKNIKQEIEKSIRTTLVVLNKISIKHAVNKIYEIFLNNNKQ